MTMTMKPFLQMKSMKAMNWLVVSTMCADAAWLRRVATKSMCAVIVTTKPRLMKWTGTP